MSDMPLPVPPVGADIALSPDIVETAGTAAVSTVTTPKSFLEPTTRGLFQWPQRVADALSDPEAACRLHSLLLGKIVVASDYSGYASEIEALTCGFRSLSERHGWQFAEMPFIFKRVCDIASVPQKALKALSEQSFNGKMCVFEDVVEHCHPNAVAYLRAAVPPEDCTQAEAEDAYAHILEWLLQWIFPVDGKQRCLVHGAQKSKSAGCCVSPMGVWVTNAKSLLVKKRKCVQAQLDAEDAEREDGPTNEHLARVLSPETDEDATCAGKPGLDRPLSLAFAGVTCDGWSSMGSQRRFGHASELPHAVWLTERLTRSEQNLEDVAFLECTQKYPAAQKLSPLQNTHKILHFKCSPTDLGFPVTRCRVFGACVNLRTMCWVGPDDWEQDFKAKFFKTCVASGDLLLTAPDSDRFAEYEIMAAQQKNFIPAASFASLSEQDLLASTLTPGQQQRVEKYLQARKAREGPAGQYLFDADHHLEARRMAGQHWPCMLTHGCILSAPRGGRLQVATAMEHFSAQGLHLFEASTLDNPVSPLKSILQDMKPCHLKQLSGRGIHVAVLSAFKYYVLSNIMPAWQAYPSSRSLSWEILDTEGDADAD